MSEYGFGYYDGDQGEGEIQPPNPAPEPGNSAMKALRAKADADSKALKEMRAELDALRQRARQSDVADVLRSKGYDPGVAKLYQGEPDKVDEWLTANGALFAKHSDGEIQQQAPAGPPASTLSAESQAQMQQMQAAGNDGVTVSRGSGDDVAAALAAAKTPEDFEKVAQANGWQYSLDGLFG